MKFVIIIAALALLVDCAHSRSANARDQTTHTTSAPIDQNTAAPSAQAGPSPASETQGGRPQEEAAPASNTTSYDAREEAVAADQRLTRQIREELMSNTFLSFMAKNVSIITNNKRVVLLGYVKNEQERLFVLSTAKKLAGADAVDDELRIQPADPMRSP